VRVREHVAHVQRAGDGGRRGVDGVHLLAGLRPVEQVGSTVIVFELPNDKACYQL
jgi:hypothetical protein